MTDHELPGYVLHQRIGVGAAAEVFRAEPLGTPGRILAVKRLRVGAPPRAVDELRREADALARLSHPSLLRVLDIVPDGDGIALVLPYAVGGSLADRIAAVDGGLGAAEVADLGARLGSALAAAHNIALVHRDVKPGNVLFDAEGQPLLADFGTARLTSELAPVAGTAEYLDPAVLAGAPPDARTDVYGLGITLYEALAGVPPYAGSTPRQTLAAADRGIHVPLGELTDAPAALLATIERAMQRDPGDRFPTANELAGHLDEHRRRLEAGASGHHAPPPPPPSPGGGSAGVLGAVPRPAQRRGDEPARALPTPPLPSPAADPGPTERSSTALFGPAPPHAARTAPPSRGLDRRLLVAAAVLAILVPLAVAWWLLRGSDEVDLVLEGRGGDVTDAEHGTTDPTPPDADPDGTGTGPDAADGQPLPPCDGVEPPTPGDDPADGASTVLHADVEGRGCTVPVVWDGQQLAVPWREGGTVRYDLGAEPDDVLLLGDWNCDGRAAPGLYRPADGQVFLFDEFSEEATARGTATGIEQGEPLVVRDEDGCERVDVEPPR